MNCGNNLPSPLNRAHHISVCEVYWQSGCGNAVGQQEQHQQCHVQAGHTHELERFPAQRRIKYDGKLLAWVDGLSWRWGSAAQALLLPTDLEEVAAYASSGQS